jgi:hypothetical protein
VIDELVRKADRQFCLLERIIIISALEQAADFPVGWSISSLMMNIMEHQGMPQMPIGSGANFLAVSSILSQYYEHGDNSAIVNYVHYCLIVNVHYNAL